jgi:hypothetical protein
MSAPAWRAIDSFSGKKNVVLFLAGEKEERS